MLYGRTVTGKMVECVLIMYRIVQNFDGGNIDRLASFRSSTGKILTDSLLDNLYLLYN